MDGKVERKATRDGLKKRYGVIPNIIVDNIGVGVVFPDIDSYDGPGGKLPMDKDAEKIFYSLLQEIALQRAEAWINANKVALRDVLKKKKGA